MFRSASLCAAALLALLPLCSAQYKSHAKTPKPEPTEAELVEYIRGALLSLSPADGLNDNFEVSYDADAKVLSMTQPNGRCDVLIPSLNANNAIWDVYDPSDTDHSREKVLRLTMVSVTGKTARTCYDRLGRVDATMLANRARFLFSLPKTEEIPEFQDKMAKAFKKLIAASGGTPEKDIF